MSIEDIKKKAKLSLDEMHDNKDVGLLDVQKSNHTNLRKEDKKKDNTESHPSIRNDEKLNCKITFNTSERLLDAFNDLYATRIIEKRKTDKSALLNEALELLLEKENRR